MVSLFSNQESTLWYSLLFTALSLALLSLRFPDALLRMGGVILGKAFTLLRPRRRASHGIWIANEFIPDVARLRHSHILGATGTGKTVLLEKLIFEDIERGHGVFIIDPKGDRNFYNRLKEFCASVGRLDDLHLLSATYPQESVRWNPCRLGNSSELQSKWFNSGVYQEPFYAKACELGLLQALDALVREKPDGFTLSHLVKKLQLLGKETKNQNLEGLFLELLNFAQGEWGALLCALPQKGDPIFKKEISLLDLTRKTEILYVELPTEGKSVQSSRIGKLLLQEIMLISGMRKQYPALIGEKPFSIYVDEFDTFATESFSTFLNKGRSSNFMIHLAHQTLSDLEKVSNTFMGQILGNCSVRFTFRIDDPDDCETLARFIGTKSVTKKTFQTEHGLLTGRSSNRETQEFKVHPDVIKQLSIGECILSMKTERIVRKLRIPPPKNVARSHTLRPLERKSTDFISKSNRDFKNGVDALEEFLSSSEFIK